MEKRITTPLTLEKTRDLHCGDNVLISGVIYTGRDAAHKRLVELLQQTIINVLAKTFNLPYADAYNQWFRAQLVIDPQVVMIIENLIERGTKFGRGIPIVINRNRRKLGSLYW